MLGLQVTQPFGVMCGPRQRAHGRGVALDRQHFGLFRQPQGESA